MSRRQFLQRSLTLASLGLLYGCGLLPGVGPPPRVARIGYLSGTAASEVSEGFWEGLRELGYVEGQGVVIEWRFAEGRLERLPEMAADLVRLQPDVIAANSDPAVHALKQLTQTIPIVMTVVGDPVGNGWVASLSRPGGNVTGLTNIAPALSGKRLELLKEVVPGLTLVAVVRNPTIQTHALLWRETQDATAALGLEVKGLEMKAAEDFESVFEAAAREHAEGLIVLPEPVHTSTQNRARFLALAAQSRLPTIYAITELVETGGLMAYGPSHPNLNRRAATYVDKILKGAKPADLPVEQPTKFDFVINLKTAQALGLTIPQSVLVQATEVIQ